MRLLASLASNWCPPNERNAHSGNDAPSQNSHLLLFHKPLLLLLLLVHHKGRVVRQHLPLVAKRDRHGHGH